MVFGLTPMHPTQCIYWRLRPLLLSLLCIFSVHFALAQPAIQSFSPEKGPMGTTVTITGSGFSNTPVNNIVYFGPVRAVVEAANATSLTVKVPGGASARRIAVTVNQRTAWSNRPFIVTFPDGGNFDYGFWGDRFDSSTGPYPYAVAMADLDGDGKIDLVNTNNGNVPASSISLFLNTSNKGDIAFATRKDITVPDMPRDIVTGDFDGDGKQDLAVSYIVDHGIVQVFRNESTPGNLQLSAPITLSVGASPYALVVGDIDKDGRPDIVSANNLSGNVSLLRNTTTGNTLSFVKTEIYTGIWPADVDMGDLDNDGKPEVVVTHELGNAIVVLKNNSTPGAVAMQALPAIQSFGALKGIAVGDLDGDGLADVPCIEPDSLKLSMYRNTTTGGAISFAAPIRWGIIEAPGFYKPYHLKMDDLTGDGKLDMMVAGPGTSVNLYRNLSTPGNLNLTMYYHLSSFSPYELASGDLDNDGKPDVAAVNFTHHKLSIWRNQGNEPVVYRFSPTSAVAGTTVTIEGSRYTQATGVSFGGVPAASFTIDSDGRIRAVVGTGNSGAVAVTNAYGTGRKDGFEFAAPPVIGGFSPTLGGKDTLITITGTNFIHLKAVKIGGVDVASYTVVSPTVIRAIAGSGATGPVSVTTDFGSYDHGTFTYYEQPVITSFTPESGAKGTVLTITGQHLLGTRTLSVGGYPVVSFLVQSNTQLTAVMADGGYGDVRLRTPGGVATKGIFRFAPVVVQSITPGRGPAGTLVQITGQHFSNVSDSNLVFFGTTRGKVVNASNNLLTVEVPAAATLGPLSVVAHGTTGYYPRGFLQTYNNGQAGISKQSYGWAGAFSTPGDPTQSIVADLDGDGRLDVLVMADFNKGLAYLRNTSVNGKVSFEAPVPLPGDMGYRAYPMLLGDLDSDGRPEIVVNYASSLRVFKNHSTTSKIAFADYVEYPLANSANNVLIADFDGDGRQDLVYGYADANYKSRLGVSRNVGSNGQIAFAPTLDIAGGDNTQGLKYSADLDLDGKIDLLMRNNDLLTAFRNTSTPGNFQFTASASQPVLNGYYYNIIGDINDDGLADVVLISEQDQKLMTVYRNTSGGGKLSFTESMTLPMPEVVNGTVIGQLDGDGIPDVGIMPASRMTTILYQNKSNGSSVAWGTGVDFATDKALYKWITTVSVGDVDGDGKPDMIAHNNPGDQFTILRNQAGEAVITRCANDKVQLQGEVAGNTYQWQVNDGSGFKDIADDAIYQGTHTRNLQIVSIPYNWDSYEYRCITDGVAGVRSNLVVNAVRPFGTLKVEQDIVCGGGFIRVELERPALFPSETKLELMESINDGAYKVVNTSTTSYPQILSYPIDQVAGQRKYYFRMTPVEGAACPVPTSSNIDSVKVFTTPRPLVQMDGQSMRVTNVDASTLYVWMKVTGSGKTEVFSGTGAAGATFATRESGTYLVQARPKDCWISSEELNYAYTAVTAIDGARLGVRAYPIPADDVLYIETLRLSDAWETLYIVAPDGRRQQPILSVAGRTQVSVPLAGLKPGIYYVVLNRQRKAPAVLKFMKK
ncbi:FG-GAP-like repeat-containing protein [Paraflavitalea sp. CAU 1676]|uniref:FG-GAP-like repeat-containing protein n=1 Tax=Paraflavitalea sp. CAU 1676 TaxID=3032598 RepID=UPI0023D9C185|nr:FG-GAP-like repeat-containing protein [Paraflavitalea sp. CAU 1676]MDF2193465.1 FG-GAP-like repeat-containing protein [Paraflavitalea sp. CAU 1676]